MISLFENWVDKCGFPERARRLLFKEVLKTKVLVGGRTNLQKFKNMGDKYGLADQYIYFYNFIYLIYEI